MGGTVTRRTMAALGAVALVATLVAGLAAQPAQARSSFGFSRTLSGADRYDTARLMALDTFGKADSVLLTTGQNFPDALAASYLAGDRGVPILLTAKDSIPAPTTSALHSLETRNITIIGGTAAVSETVENTLRGTGYFVNRISGSNRYATALAVASTPLPGNVRTLNGERTAILASGETFADALAAGPLAYSGQYPLLLTPSDVLSKDAEQAFSQLHIERVLLLGGKAALTQGVEDAVRGMSINVTRLAGADRTETATVIAEFEVSHPELLFSRTHVNLARGDAGGMGADALAGGPHAGVERAPILLAADPTHLDAPSLANTGYLHKHAFDLLNGHIFGGPSAVSGDVQLAASYAAGLTPPEAPSGLSTPTVYLVNVAEDFFVSTVGRTYYYGDAGDTYALKSVANSVLDFEALLNTGDIVTVNYNAVLGSPSSFNVTDDQILPTSTPSVTVAGNHVTIVVTESPLRSYGTIYTLQRATSLLPACLGGFGSFGNVGAGGLDQDYNGIFDDFPAPGCYQYRVVASVVQNPPPLPPAPPPVFIPVANASIAVSGVSATATVPNQTADTVRPRITDARTTSDVGTTGRLDAGDVQAFAFDERMDSLLGSAGTTYRLSDADGTGVEVICGTNATCVLGNVTDGNPIAPRVLYSTLTVTMTSTPSSISAGGNPGLQFPGTAVLFSAHFKDANNNPLDPALSDVTL